MKEINFKKKLKARQSSIFDILCFMKGYKQVQIFFPQDGRAVHTIHFHEITGCPVFLIRTVNLLMP